MSFVGVTKNVGKIQKSITYWLPRFWFDFFISARLIMIALDKWVPSFIISMDPILFIFLYLRNTWKIVIMMSI